MTRIALVSSEPVRPRMAGIGIRFPQYRARAVAIGEALEVLKDYPASPGCTSPFAPLWIDEMVRRRETA